MIRIREQKKWNADPQRVVLVLTVSHVLVEMY
jgi:hypothetical protein